MDIHALLSRARNAAPREIALPLALITLLALMLRLWRLGDLQVDYEEFVGLYPLQADSYWGYLTGLRKEDPPAAPLAFTLLYFWTRIFGESLYAARMPFVLLSIAHIPLLYVLAREVFRGKRYAATAGLFAGLLYALSPVHIYHAQEVRHTTTLTFFALLCATSLLVAARTQNRKWYAVNIVCNAMTALTQLLAPVLLVPQGVYLLARGHLRQAIAWGGAMLLCLLPWLGWSLAKPEEADFAYADFIVPTFQQAVSRMVDHESIMSYDLESHHLSELGDMGARIAPSLIALLPTIRFTLLLSGLIGLAVLAGIALRSLREEIKATPPLFLVLYWLLPPLVLLSVSILMLPMWANRYFLYVSFAVYLSLGAMVGLLRPYKVLQIVAATVILGAFATLTLVQVGGDSRPRFREALAIVDAGSLNPPLIFAPELTSRILEVNGGAPTLDINGGAFNTHLTAYKLANAYDTPSTPVWVLRLVMSYPDGIAQKLQQHGCFYRVTELRSFRTVQVYEVLPLTGCE